MAVARRFLADRRRSFLWWSLGMLLTVGLTVALWPSVRGQEQFEDLMRDLPPAVQALFGAQEGIPFVGWTAVGLVALVASAPAVGLLDGVALVRLAGAGAALMALALLHASLAFATGCAFGRRGIASAVAGAVAVTGYLLVGLTAAAETPGALRWLSPWHWYLDRNLLVDAPPATATLLPLGLALALTAAGGWRFVQRDLRLP